MCDDDVRAVEFDPDITELLCAIDNLLNYAVARDPQFISKIAINMLNCIDYAVSGLPEDILVEPTMREEHERQKRLLTGATSGVQGS